MSSSVKVVVTGAAGQIAYSLIPRLVDGKTFGNKKVDLSLVEIPQVVNKLEGLVMGKKNDTEIEHIFRIVLQNSHEGCLSDRERGEAPEARP